MRGQPWPRTRRTAACRLARQPRPALQDQADQVAPFQAVQQIDP